MTGLRAWPAACAVVLTALAPGCAAAGRADGAQPLRVGFLTNVTSTQALLMQSQGILSARLGGRAAAELRAFSAGPAAVEALAAGAIDAAYLGPAPVIASFVRSHGENLRVVAGAASGGARFMVTSASGIEAPADLAGKTLSTPGVGNTQDVALRSYLAAHGLAPRENGGAVSVRPMHNSSILQLMRRGDIDGAWVPEPWASRLEAEAGARTFVDERDLWPGGRFPSVVLAVSQRLLDERPHLLEPLVESHIDATLAIAAEPRLAARQANTELALYTMAPLAEDVLESAFARFEPVWDPMPGAIERDASEMAEIGYLGRIEPNLGGLVDTAELESALAARGLVMGAGPS